jgi:uncharacterized membrane-anchored protein
MPQKILPSPSRWQQAVRNLLGHPSLHALGLSFRERLALVVARQLSHEDMLATLTEQFIVRCPPAHIRSDNGADLLVIPDNFL